MILNKKSHFGQNRSFLVKMAHFGGPKLIQNLEKVVKMFLLKNFKKLFQRS